MTKFTQMAANEDANNEDGGASRRRIHLREISGDSDSPLETVGQDLRAARIRRGDDLAAVSRALKIRKDHLDALEGDRLEDLPGKTYAIGFVRSYARHLGLDANTLVERFKAEISGRGEDHAMPAANLHDDDGRRLPHGWRILAAIIGIALLWGVWHIFFAARDTAPPVPPPPTLSQNQTQTQTQTLARITDAPKPAAPQAATPSATQTPPAPSSASPVATVSPASGTPPASQAAVPAVEPAQALGTPTRDTRVILRARGATRITVRGRDGRIYLNRDLAPGEAYPVPNVAGLNLALSNAGAVEVDLDGIALGRAGAEGQVLGRVSLDPQSLTDRFNSDR